MSKINSMLPNKVIIQSLVLQLLIGAPFLSFFLLLLLGVHPEPGHAIGPLDQRSSAERVAIFHQWAALFSAAAMFACMGALVSYLSRRSEEVTPPVSDSSILSIHVVGSIFGVIMLLLFLGKFVAGNLFPNFDSVTFLTLHQNFRNVDGWSKLFVWSFIAGFSERLVPELLQNFSREISKNTDTKTKEHKASDA